MNSKNSINVKNNLTKYIIKSYKVLKHYSKNNKFSYKKKIIILFIYIYYTFKINMI